MPEPQDLVSIDFWESYDPEEVCNTGFGLIGSEPFHIRAMCFLCGSAGHEKVKPSDCNYVCAHESYLFDYHTYPYKNFNKIGSGHIP